MREYGLDYTDRLAEAGFMISTTDIIKDLSAEELERYALLHYGKMTAEELVYLVNKN